MLPLNTSNDTGGEKDQIETLKWALDHNPCSIICVVAPWLPDSYVDNGIRQMLRLSEEISMAHFLIVSVVAQGQNLDVQRKPYHRPSNNVRWSAMHEQLISSKLLPGVPMRLPATLVVQGKTVKEVVPGLRPADVEVVASKARQAAKLPESGASTGGSVKGAFPSGGGSSQASAAPLKMPDFDPCAQTAAELLAAATQRAAQIHQKLKQVSAAGKPSIDAQQLQQRASEVGALLHSSEQLRHSGGEGEKSRTRVLHERGHESSANLAIAEGLLDKCEGSAGQEQLAKTVGAVLERVNGRAPWLEETLDTLRNLQGGGGGGSPSKRLSPLASSLASLAVRSPAARASSPPTAARLFTTESHASPTVPSSPSPLPLAWGVVGSSPLSATLPSTAMGGEEGRAAREGRRAVMKQVRQQLVPVRL